MAAVIAIIAVISATYHELIGRFPSGGGQEGIAHAFGEGWAFIPLGALLVDFTLTVAVSCAAGASALIAYMSELEPIRTPIGLGLVVLVAGNVLLGQGGRVVFANATIAFIALSICVIVSGVISSPGSAAAGGHATVGGTPLLVTTGLGPSLLAIPLGMALATTREFRPHLRIENLVLPSGPTAIDMVANAVFYHGLIRAIVDSDRIAVAERDMHCAGPRRSCTGRGTTRSE
jgi:hypothetical protein